MGALDRIRRRFSGTARPPAPRPAPASDRGTGPAEESRLWDVLREDPNDVDSFHALADIVRRRAEEGHEGGDPRKAADDAVWALAEELAHSPRAWYPLIELGRLSVHDDREQALRRLATASDRDTTGCALAKAVQMLREEGMPAEGLGLGVGHWHLKQHGVVVGQQLVLAAAEAGRPADARRTLDALAAHPDTEQVAAVRGELERAVEEAERVRAAGPGSGSIPVVDVREKKLFKRN
ncbi:MAG TPA: hypothetical protein VE781_10755 [Kineosporiaceae bacterium]|jgi:hypothetical protein|nr:hypothetical protein [Kineosporiaceae bacterium]